MVNPTAYKFLGKVDYYIVDDNICDYITLSDIKEIVGFYEKDYNGLIHKCSDPEKIDYIINHNYLVKDGVHIPIFISCDCRRCSDCLNSKRQEYECRALFEACDHPYMFFFTLTYDDDHLPNFGLFPRHVSSFIKRFRENLAYSYSKRFNVSLEDARDITFFRCLYVGEYGKRTQRPHYHGVFFFKNYIPITLINWLYEIYKKSWIYGRILDLQLIRDPVASTKYITKYITKQQMFPAPKGKTPCFIRGPHKCGLGAYCLGSHLDDILHSTDNTVKLRINDRVVSVRIPKFLIQKIFPCFSRKYGGFKDILFELNNIRDELKVRNLLDPFTHSLDPTPFDVVLRSCSWITRGSTSLCSKALRDKIESYTRLPFSSESVVEYYKDFSDEELNKFYKAGIDILVNCAPTLSDFFSECKLKYEYYQKMQIPDLTYSEKRKRLEKSKLNNVNFVEKRMLNENFDLLLHL